MSQSGRLEALEEDNRRSRGGMEGAKTERGLAAWENRLRPGTARLKEDHICIHFR